MKGARKKKNKPEKKNDMTFSTIIGRREQNFALVPSPTSEPSDLEKMKKSNKDKKDHEIVTIDNKLYFPPFPDMPADAILNRTYYKTFDGLNYSARCHWCFLGEIIDVSLSQFIRNVTIVRDVAGRRNIVIAFYQDGPLIQSGLNPADLKVGHTICIRYAEQHAFLDGSRGVRVEDIKFVKVIKTNLDALFDMANIRIRALRQDDCWHCDKRKAELPEQKLLKCGRCKYVRYCGKECQTADWGQHKKHCKFIPDYLELTNLDFPHFEAYVPFH